MRPNTGNVEVNLCACEVSQCPEEAPTRDLSLLKAHTSDFIRLSGSAKRCTLQGEGFSNGHGESRISMTHDKKLVFVS